MNDFLSLKICSAIKISPLHLKALERLGILTLRDLIFYTPKGYKEKKLYPNLSNCKIRDTIIIKGKFEKGPVRIQNRTVLSFKTDDNIVEIIYFGKVPIFLKTKLKIGCHYIIEGELAIHGQNFQIIHPEFIFSDSEITPIEPLYNLTYALGNKKLFHYILKAMMSIRPMLAEISEHNVLAQTYNLPTFYTSLLAIHKPIKHSSYAKDVNIAIKRLATDELIAHQICLNNIETKFKSAVYTKNTDLQNQVLQNVGFNLTPSQLSALADIENDQSKNTQMLRLLQGDVGSGKTIVALLSMLNVINKGQAALMVPTELLAMQHYKYMCRALEGTKVTCCLLSGNMSVKEKKEALKMIKSNALIIVGTHALFQETVQFHNLKYVVIDEQHRFGVRQRLALMEKTDVADLLLMTATPIPRSLAMTMLGNISISQMTKSQHKAKIRTVVMKDSRQDEVYSAMQRIINKGEKVYWICPFIENNEEYHAEISNVEDRFEKIKAIFGTDQAAMMHGGTETTEREQIMNNFANGPINILVATTIVEVGVDVAKATLIIIENAERFGLAQLHQLRGRVGRSSLESYCILIYSSVFLSTTALQRLNFIKSCDDGFLIAEEDLKLRGSGDMLGVKQSGSEDFYFVDKAELPAEYYQEVIKAAKKIVSKSPEYNFYTTVISKKHSCKSTANI